MKKRINTYTFNALTHKITLTDITVQLDALLLITNITNNVIIFNFADSTKKATVSGSTITLQYDTSNMSDSDELQIFYDDALEYGLTDSELRNTPIPISGTVVTGGLTDVQLRATDLPVTLSGETVDISASSLPLPSGASIESKQDLIITALSNLLTELQRKADLTETQPVSGPLTDTQLRATDIKVSLDGESVPVTGTFWQATQPISGALTDTELRTSDVKVSLDSEIISVTGPLTDTQLRASAVPVSDINILSQLQTLNTNDATFMMRYLVSIMSDPVYLNKVSNALNVLLLSGSTTAVTGTLTGVTTVTGLTNIGGYGADQVSENLKSITWQSIRGLMI